MLTSKEAILHRWYAIAINTAVYQNKQNWNWHFIPNPLPLLSNSSSIPLHFIFIPNVCCLKNLGNKTRHPSRRVLRASKVNRHSSRPASGEGARNRGFPLARGRCGRVPLVSTGQSFPRVALGVAAAWGSVKYWGRKRSIIGFIKGQGECDGSAFSGSFNGT